jgi:hypothetical protein
MTMVRSFLGCLALLAFTASLASAGPVPPGRPADNSYSPVAERQCRAHHGEYRRVCMLGRYSCVTPFRDAGHACIDSGQCQGRRCIYRGGGHPVGPVIGQCVANSDPCGCFTTVEHGFIAGGLCVD